MIKLQQIANQYGVNLDTHDETMAQSKILNEKYDALVKKKNILVCLTVLNTLYLGKIKKYKKMLCTHLPYY